MWLNLDGRHTRTHIGKPMPLADVHAQRIDDRSSHTEQMYEVNDDEPFTRRMRVCLSLSNEQFRVKCVGNS